MISSSITLGVNLDPILLNLALSSPSDILFISKDKQIRYYKTDGSINISNKNMNVQKILNNKEGYFLNNNDEKIFFTHITRITENDGYIVLIETRDSRTQLIQQITNTVETISKTVAIRSGILIIAAMIIITLILTRIITAITNPINQLSAILFNLNERKIGEIEIDEKYKKRKDEVGILYSSFFNMIESMKEGVKVRGILDKVVSRHVAEKIIKEGVTLGGEIRTISVMFCDIRNFTAITEKMNPKDVLIMLNECLTILSAVIDDFDGIIDKYEGDNIMTLFGAPVDCPDHSNSSRLMRY